jgi:hypothetical protein
LASITPGIESNPGKENAGIKTPSPLLTNDWFSIVALAARHAIPTLYWRREFAVQVRKATLASILAKARPGIRFNEHIEGDGPTVFAHACKLGLEGIVSKRKGSPYRSGRSPDWLKMKNPACEAVTREAEEDWGKEKRR